MYGILASYYLLTQTIIPRIRVHVSTKVGHGASNSRSVRKDTPPAACGVCHLERWKHSILRTVHNLSPEFTVLGGARLAKHSLYTFSMNKIKISPLLWSVEPVKSMLFSRVKCRLSNSSEFTANFAHRSSSAPKLKRTEAQPYSRVG